MAKQDFEILGGLKIGSTLAFDSLAQIQIANVGLHAVAGTGSIADLSDVNITGIQNGQILKWDGSQFAVGTDSDTFLTGITSSSNTALGVDAFSTGGGADNVAIGHSALQQSGGSRNTVIGDDAGSAMISGDDNVIIGRNDGSSINGLSKQLIISDGAGAVIMSGDAAQKVTMAGDMSVATVLTFGSTTETTDKISEGSSNRYFTVGRVEGVFDTLSTDSLTEGASRFYYTEDRFNTSFLAKTTDSLAEGDNLYYTRARFDAAFTDTSTDSLSEGSVNFYWTEGRFNTSFLAKTTDSLAEGDNLYYTRDLFDAAFTDTSTDSLSEGSVNFYWTEGRFNTSFGAKTTADLTEDAGFKYFTVGRVEDVFDTLSTDSLTEGQSNKYFTTERVEGVFDALSTDSLSEGTVNLYWTEDRFNTSFLAKTTDSLTEGSTNLYYTDARAQAAVRSDLTAGLGVTYDNASGEISIGQEVETTSEVTFGSVQIDDVMVLDTQVAAANASSVVISSFDKADFRSCRVTIQVSLNGEHHTSEMLVLHDDTSVLTTEFGSIKTSGTALATFSAAINGNDVEITASPVSGSPSYKVVRHSTKV